MGEYLIRFTLSNGLTVAETFKGKDDYNALLSAIKNFKPPQSGVEIVEIASIEKLKKGR